MQVRQQCPDPEQRDRKLIRSTFGHDGRGSLALADADAARDAHRDESCNQSKQYFLHWSSPFFHAHARHTFVLRCTVSRLLNPMVHRLRRQWGTSKGTVSLGTQLLLPRGRRRCDLRGNRRYRLWRIIFMHGGCHPVSSRLHEPFPKFWGVFCHSCQAHAFARVVYAILIGHLHSRT